MCIQIFVSVLWICACGLSIEVSLFHAFWTKLSIGKNRKNRNQSGRRRYPAWPVWSAMNRFAVAVSFLGHTTALALGVASEKRLGDQTLEGRLAYVILGCFLRTEALCRERIAAFDNLFLRDKFGSVWSKSNSAWENVEHIRISLSNVAYSTRAGAWLIGNAVGICLDAMQYKPHIWFPV